MPTFTLPHLLPNGQETTDIEGVSEYQAATKRLKIIGREFGWRVSSRMLQNFQMRWGVAIFKGTYLPHDVLICPCVWLGFIPKHRVRRGYTKFRSQSLMWRSDQRHLQSYIYNILVAEVTICEQWILFQKMKCVINFLGWLLRLSHTNHSIFRHPFPGPGL